MKDHFKRLRDKKGVHTTEADNNKKRPLSEKEKAIKELIITPHAVIVPASAILLDKRIKDAETHNRTKERYFISRKQIKKTHNFKQRILEKDKTKQKKERRFVEIAA